MKLWEETCARFEAEDLGLELPTREFSFDAIAAPAGLAALSL